MVLSGIQNWIPAQKHCGNDKKRALLKIVGFRSSTQPTKLLSCKDWQSAPNDAGVINVLLFVIPRLDRGIQKRAWRLDAASSAA